MGAAFLLGLWATPAGAQPGGGSVAEIVTPEDEDRPSEPASPAPKAGPSAEPGPTTEPGPSAAPGPTAQPAPTEAPKAPEAPADRPEDQLPADADVAPARDAYNAGRYDEASARFLALCQRHPALPALYRALARSRTWNNDHPGAVLAYEVYLAAAPEAGDRAKIEAERDLARRKAEAAGPVPRTPPGATHLEAAVARGRKGRFGGTDGAFAALDAAAKAGFFGPQQQVVTEQLAAQLAEASRAALEAWWAPALKVEPAALRGLSEGWDALAPRRAPTAQERQWSEGVAGLALLAAGDFAGAADRLGPVAPGDTRLRFAQALALVQAGRDAEAANLLDALAGDQRDPRIDLLRGLVHNRLGQPDKGTEALSAALGGE